MKRPSMGTETRYDKYTSESIEAARKSARGMGVMVNYQTSFCCKCQQDKPKKGSMKRGSMTICADCQAAAKEGAQQG